MLVLSRQRDQQIVIAEDIVVTVIEIRGDKVRLGIQAPADVTIHRREIYDLIQRQKAESDATQATPASEKLER